MKNFLKCIRAQLLVTVMITSLSILAHYSVLPSPADLARSLEQLFTKHGLILVGIASFLENCVGIGTYFPGSIVLITSMSLTSGDSTRALLTYCAIVLPAIAANIASYAAGYLAGKEANRRSGQRSAGNLALWYTATYWHPQLAGITAMASGADGVSFLQYLAFFLPISLSWTMAWALFLYKVGSIVDVAGRLTLLFYVYLAGWFLWGILKCLQARKSRGDKSS